MSKSTHDFDCFETVVRRDLLTDLFMWEHDDSDENGVFKSESLAQKPYNVGSIYCQKMEYYWKDYDLRDDFKPIKRLLFQYMDKVSKQYSKSEINKMTIRHSCAYAGSYGRIIDSIIKYFETNIEPNFDRKSDKNKYDTLLLISISNWYYCKGLQMCYLVGFGAQLEEDYYIKAQPYFNKSIKYYPLNKTKLLHCQTRSLMRFSRKITHDEFNYFIKMLNSIKREKIIYTQKQFDQIIVTKKNELIEKISKLPRMDKDSNDCVIL